ncbi:DUF309 domain-containing protein [Jatrophihabitans endophyticus]|uniref:DUF309 domain-containing protein n=1 Tax=Jatrophihabitans endophyticus TaxID=1206085 RepID=UPI000A932D50|nr:DUF309 domain-containing protein [Jatrophihabitans endophyticus]
MPTTDDTIVRPPRGALVEAQRLLDMGAPFHAHEVLEGAWKAAPAEERELWQGLAQLAVGLTHAARGNRTGAVALLTRGRERIAAGAPEPPYGIDVPALVRWADAAVVGLANGADVVDAPPRLVRDPA